MSEAPVDWLLTQWRAARHPSTAQLLCLVCDQHQVELPRLSAKKTDAVRAWLLAVKTENPYRLSARLKQLEAFARSTSASLLWPLFEALAKQPPDPRIATLATRILVREIDLNLTVKLTRRLLDCVEAHGDDSHFRDLEMGLSLPLLGDDLAARAVRLMQRGLTHPPIGPELPLAERTRLTHTQWEIPASTSPPIAAAVFAPVWAAPREMACKQVLADALLERGDVRGEFIVLQLRDVSRQRQRVLLKAHGRQWLGALADVVDLKDDPPQFEHGFVTEVSVRKVKLTQFLLAADAPEWATVRRVRRGLQRFSPAMVGLEDAGWVELEALAALARDRLCPGLRSVAVAAAPTDVVEVLGKLAQPPRWLALHASAHGPTRAWRDGLPSLSNLPGLERLRLSALRGTAMPELLGQMGLDWLPASLTQIDLRDGPQVITLKRQPGGWNLTLLDGDFPTMESSSWKSLLANLGWLRPLKVHLTSWGDFNDERLETVRQLAQRFELPISTDTVVGLPEALAW